MRLAQVAVLVGALLITAGVYGLADWPAAVLAGGIQLVCYGLWLVDVDKPQPRRTIERSKR